MNKNNCTYRSISHTLIKSNGSNPKVRFPSCENAANNQIVCFSLNRSAKSDFLDYHAYNRLVSR